MNLLSIKQYNVPGDELGLIWVLPFVGMLLSIAVLPMVCPNLWSKQFGRISVFWSAAIILPMGCAYGLEVMYYELLHAVLKEYIPFILFAGSLFTITGGINIGLKVDSSPIANTLIITAGTVLASVIGTTGAAMLLIRPLIRLNQHRKTKTHIVVFFIFLVCNIGGSLTALGDPPLFLGYLMGINFFWTTKNLLLPFVIMTVPLIIIFFNIDSFFHNKEESSKKKCSTSDCCAEGIYSKINIDGKINFLLLIMMIVAILLSSNYNTDIKFVLLGICVTLEETLRNVFFIIISLLSLRLTPKKTRENNYFSWHPLSEIVKIFSGIFITIVPVISILNTSLKGFLSKIIHVTTDISGEPINHIYFWITGMLSALLDNAPTYLVFFHIAGGNPDELMGPLNNTLIAISAGSVFMGALTYIGNAPNFMVKSIAESQKVVMPSFAMYILWSILFLVPLFLLVSYTIQ